MNHIYVYKPVGVSGYRITLPSCFRKHIKSENLYLATHDGNAFIIPGSILRDSAWEEVEHIKINPDGKSLIPRPYRGRITNDMAFYSLGTCLQISPLLTLEEMFEITPPEIRELYVDFIHLIEQGSPPDKVDVFIRSLEP